MAVERWTDAMLDSLASSVSEMRDSIGEMRDSIGEMRDSIGEMRDSIDGMKITTQALLQIAAQNQRDMESFKQRQAESDRRFNILLEEVRYLGRRIDIDRE